MARLSKYCPGTSCKVVRPVNLELVPLGVEYAFQARCTTCRTVIPADGPPLRTADEIAAWVAAQRAKGGAP